MKAKPISLLLVFLLSFILVQPAQAIDDYSPEAVVADTLVVRPACLVVTVTGSVLFVVALPFAAISKSVGRTADSLIKKPGRATFTRPLGNFTELR